MKIKSFGIVALLILLGIGGDSMLSQLKSWSGEVDINEKHYSTIQDATSDFKHVSDDIHIKLYSKRKSQSKAIITALNDTVQEYRITVKRYMTETATPSFDFMKKWNNNVPMPMRTMTGVKVKETRGMVYMKLHGQAEPVVRCMRCGRQLTNPISQHYGIGPECMSKLGLVCDINDVETIKKKLVDVVWEGWIIKSAITESEEVK